MKINWQVRAKNALFWLQIALSVFLPVLGYMGLTLQDITTWGKFLGVIVSALANPYVFGMIIIGILNAITDPTTSGVGDSELAMTYTKPKEK